MRVCDHCKNPDCYPVFPIWGKIDHGTVSGSYLAREYRFAMDLCPACFESIKTLLNVNPTEDQ